MKRSYHKIIIACLIIFYTVNVKNFAQEFHFSQINNTPLINNPANAGIMESDLRISNNYRNQWRKINIPYNTIHFGIDKKVNILKQNFGFSLEMLNDLAQSNIMATNAFFAGLSYAKFYKTHQFAFGVQYGKTFKNYDEHNIVFGSQFENGIYYATIPSGEENLDNQLKYDDLNIGLLWRAKIKNLTPSFGVSVHHINTPELSFTNTEGEKLNARITLNGNIVLPVLEKYEIIPVLYYSTSSASHELITGAVGNYTIDDFMLPVNKVYALSYFRINPARNIDAVILGGGIQFLNFDMGISYDINISSLRKITKFQGAFELSIIYVTGKSGKSGSVQPCNMF